MTRPVTLVLGVLLVLVGLVWFFQGIGVLEGSPMTGVTLWAVVGPLLVLGGAALLVRGLRHRSEG